MTLIDLILAALLAMVLYLLWVQWRRRAVEPPSGEPAKAPPPASPSYYWKLTRQAGFSPDKVWPVYLGAKIVMAFGLAIGGLDLLRVGVWSLVVSVPAGFFLPDFILHLRRRRRQATIRRSLSFFLDMFVSLLQAGLSLEEAFGRAAREGLPRKHPLGKEVLQVVEELDLGRDRTVGFQALADRTGVKELRALSSALGMGLSAGISVEAILKAQADLMRAKRREDGLKRLEMANAEVLLPLVLCSFPVFVVFVLVPLALVVVDSLQTFGRVLR